MFLNVGLKGFTKEKKKKKKKVQKKKKKIKMMLKELRGYYYYFIIIIIIFFFFVIANRLFYRPLLTNCIGQKKKKTIPQIVLNHNLYLSKQQYMSISHDDQPPVEDEESSNHENDTSETLPLTTEVTQSLLSLRAAVKTSVDGEAQLQLLEQIDNLQSSVIDQTLMMFKHWNIEHGSRAGYLRREPREGMTTSLSQGGDTLGFLYSESTEQQHQSSGGGSRKKKRTQQPSSPSSNPQQQQSEIKKGLATTISYCMRALLQHVEASQASIYIFDRTTSTLRSIGSVPPTNQVIIPSHAGAQGSVFSSSVAFNIGKVDSDMAALLKLSDQQAGRCTRSFLGFPIIGSCSKNPIGVLEIINKQGGLKWTHDDEIIVYNVSSILYQILKQVPQDVLASLDGRQKHFTSIPFSTINDDLISQNSETPPAVGQSLRTQLVFRLERGTKPDGVSAAPVANCTNVKELHSYLTTLEESYRRGLNQYVLVDEEKRVYQEELQRKIQRTRVLEENITFLTNQIQSLQSTTSYNNATGGIGHRIEKDIATDGVQSSGKYHISGGDRDRGDANSDDTDSCGISPELQSTITLAHRLAATATPHEVVTTSLNTSSVDASDKVLKRSKSRSAQAVQAVKLSRLSSDHLRVISPDVYKKQQTTHQGGRMSGH